MAFSASPVTPGSAVVPSLSCSGEIFALVAAETALVGGADSTESGDAEETEDDDDGSDAGRN